MPQNIRKYFVALETNSPPKRFAGLVFNLPHASITSCDAQSAIFGGNCTK